MYLHVICPCKTWRWRPVCFYIIATPPTVFDVTRTLSVHFRQLAREGISAEKAHATVSVLVVAILVIDATALQADEPIHEEVPVTDHRPSGTAKIEIRQLSGGYNRTASRARGRSRDPRWSMGLHAGLPGVEGS